MRNLLALACALGLAGCTPGADHPASAALPSIPAPSNAPSTITIDVNLTLNTSTTIAPGISGGFKPALTTVGVGTAIRFVNSDGFSHTATALGSGVATFPAGSPLGTSALTQSGSLLSQGFSSGVLQAGAASQTLIADQRGTYLYGCFFHYGSPMRAAIVVQ